MTAEKALVPVAQKGVECYEDTIAAVRLGDGVGPIPIKPICDNLGPTLAGRREHINSSQLWLMQ